MNFKLIFQKNYEAAKMAGLACRKSIGTDNPRSCLIYAQSIEKSLPDECEQCLKALVDQFPYLTDAVVLLGKCKKFCYACYI